MVMISAQARARIHPYGRTTRVIRQQGVPFDVSLFVPVVNPFVEKQMRFKAQYRLDHVSLEDVREGLLFGNFRSFMDMRMETFSRRTRTRHFKLNPFTKKMEEVLGGKFGGIGRAAAHVIANSMVAMLGLVEWEVREDPVPDANTACIHVDVTSRFFRGHFKFRVHREVDGVIVDDDWLPEGGGDVRTPALPMAWLVLSTHPLGFEQIVERVVDEIVSAQDAGRPYIGEIGPPSEELN